MDTQEKNIEYSTINTYSTLNQLTEKTKNVWLVCHGMGYLSRYFIRYFNELPAEENYIIAPQAPSKYYQTQEFKHVGASWLTKENTKQETVNVLNYMDAVYKAENIPSSAKLIAFGYSQGVSIICRWLASRRILCDKLILHSGGIPVELKEGDFHFMQEHKIPVSYVYGTGDPYINPERVEKETNKLEKLFPGLYEFVSFEGVHEIKKEIINSLV